MPEQEQPVTIMVPVGTTVETSRELYLACKQAAETELDSLLPVLAVMEERVKRLRMVVTAIAVLTKTEIDEDHEYPHIGRQSFVSSPAKAKEGRRR